MPVGGYYNGALKWRQASETKNEDWLVDKTTKQNNSTSFYLVRQFQSWPARYCQVREREKARRGERKEKNCLWEHTNLYSRRVAIVARRKHRLTVHELSMSWIVRWMNSSPHQPRHRLIVILNFDLFLTILPPDVLLWHCCCNCRAAVVVVRQSDKQKRKTK